MTILQVQLLLRYLGYSPGALDGVAGKNTYGAVAAFQKQEGLTVDGRPGAQTQAALLAAVSAGRMYQPDPEATQEEKVTGFWQELRYFRREEPYIACSCGRCGGFPVEPSERLMRLADSIRDQAGTPMTPTSTVRCKQHNAEVGGVSNSRHLLGKAMDFSIRGWSSAKTLSLVTRQPGIRYAYAIDGSHVHMDVE